MILSYIDLFDKKRLQHRIKASVTANHPASHYGQPVILRRTENAGFILVDITQIPSAEGK